LTARIGPVAAPAAPAAVNPSVAIAVPAATAPKIAHVILLRIKMSLSPCTARPA
jgi:hypothetical protein